ncbi:uncharacterized protein LOC101889304 isoform X1 [Musca domestica]|nr:uncharacterized protein LOC101889304 isoform X1 [Musca domestica]
MQDDKQQKDEPTSPNMSKQPTTAESQKSATSHHSIMSSVNSNGDAVNPKHFANTPGNSKTTLSSPVKENGSIPQNSCSKAETLDFNDMNDMGEDEAKAATKIQAVFRGHKVRATMKKSETTSAATSSNNTPASGAAAATENEPTKEELEAEFDPNDKELCSAALKIQATFRGHLTRKLVAKDTPEDVDIQEITKKVAEELDIDLSDPELNKAATKIQASFRGHKTRKETQPIE